MDGELGYLVSISAKMSNVLLHPLQSHHLIPQSEIPGDDVVATAQEAQRTKAVVDAHENLDTKEIKMLCTFVDCAKSNYYNVVIHCEHGLVLYS